MRARWLVVLALAGITAACVPPPQQQRFAAVTPVVVAAAGDISCPALTRVRPTACQQAAVGAAVADADLVVALGDLQYPGGSGTSWAGYDAAWGSLALKTLPIVGNHEYLTPGAQGFYDYFASKGVTIPHGAWSRAIGNGWTFVAVDDNCGKIDCTAELAALNGFLDASGPCTVVAYHRPRWSSGDHGSSLNKKADKLWQAIVAHNVRLVINGHEHSYERTTPFGSTTEVIVGTGGKSQDLATPPAAFTAAQVDATFGHLRLFLSPNAFTGEYRNLSGTTLDSFGGSC